MTTSQRRTPNNNYEKKQKRVERGEGGRTIQRRKKVATMILKILKINNISNSVPATMTDLTTQQLVLMARTTRSVAPLPVRVKQRTGTLTVDTCTDGP